MFVVMQALHDPSLRLQKESDILNEHLFNYAKQIYYGWCVIFWDSVKQIPSHLGSGLEFMFDAVNQMNDIPKKQKMLGHFLLHLDSCNQEITTYGFSHSDIDLATKYLMSVVD